MSTGNRVLWTVIGLLLAAAGVLGLGAGLGWFNRVDRGSAVWPSAWTRWWQEHERAAVTLLVLAALLAVIAGITLMRRQLRTRPQPSIAVLGPGHVHDAQGRTRKHLNVRARGLSKAVAADFAGHREVRQASVALTGDPASPVVDAHLRVTSRATVPMLADHLSAAMRRLESTLGGPARSRVLLTVDSDGHAPQRVS